MRELVSNGSARAGASAISMSILWEIFWGPVTGIVPGDLLGPFTFAVGLLVVIQVTRSLAPAIQLLPVRPIR